MILIHIKKENKMFPSFIKNYLFSVLLIVFSLTVHAGEIDLEENEHFAVNSIITSFLLRSTQINAPTLTSDAPTQTMDNNVTLEVNGIIGQVVYVNNISMGTIGANGTMNIVFNLVLGDNTFVLTFRDNAGSESLALTFSISMLVPNIAPLANAGSDQNISLSSDLSPSMGTNMDGVTDWTSAHPFVNLMKYSREWITGCISGSQPDCSNSNSWDTGESAQLDLDENGSIKSLPAPEDAPVYSFARLYWALDSHYVGGRHIVTYDGEGTLGYHFGMKLISSTQGRDVIEINSSAEASMITLTATDPQGTGNYIRNIKIVREIYENIDVINNPFNPDYLTLLSNFQVLRFMDWMHTNNSPQTNWANRTQTNDYTYTSLRGVPIAIQLKLANTLLVSPWVNVPHQVDDDYITQFATQALQELNSTLDIYVEYTNEFWNGIFSQGAYTVAQGRALWTGSIDSDFTISVNWYGHQSARICDIWKGVWAGESDRVHCVMAGQVSNTWVLEQAMNCPLSALAPCSAHGIDEIAIAPYFAGNLGLASEESRVETWDLDTLFNEINTINIPQSLTWVEEHISLANRLNVDLTAYEGGQHLVGVYTVVNNTAITTLFNNANRDSRMQGSYETFLNGWKSRGGNLFMNFSDISEYSKWGSWGTLEYLTQPTTGKLQALLNYLVANPIIPTKVTLTGVASDSDGSIVSYLWEQVSGMSVILNNASTSQAYFDIPTILGRTELRFSLTVIDNQGATAIDEVLIILE
jgi:hypothetical protein